MHIFKRRRKIKRASRKRDSVLQNWTAIGTHLTFRAEVMPGRGQVERTYAVAKLLTNGRVELVGLTGEHTETEFEATR